MASAANPSALYNDAILDEHGQAYQPALGPTWHHCVSIRLTMNTTLLPPEGGVAAADGQQMVKQKYVSVTKSPICGPHSVPFIITAAGLAVSTVNSTPTSK